MNLVAAGTSSPDDPNRYATSVDVVSCPRIGVRWTNPHFCEEIFPSSDRASQFQLTWHSTGLDVDGMESTPVKQLILHSKTNCPMIACQVSCISIFNYLKIWPGNKDGH